LARGDRLTVPAVNERGDWLVKFPDYKFADVPRNEYAMMRIAASCGINVPEVRLVHRDELDGLPDRMWPNAERWAYAVKRFDRADDGRTLVHIEDFAQVQDIYPQQKYEGSFETVAALSYRGRDPEALREFTRRLAFCVLFGNGDAHLKNWSLIYLNKHIPTLAPAYDLVSTVCYRDYTDGPEDLGLKFRGSTRFDAVRLSSFEGLRHRLGSRFGSINIDLVDIVVATARRAERAWREHGELLKDTPALYRVVDEWLGRWSVRLRG
jgi:serine/threonine-protein kinase HipA